MIRCTNLVRRAKYVEIEPATVRSSAKWGNIYVIEHCGKPAVRSREGTHWCADCFQAKGKGDR